MLSWLDFSAILQQFVLMSSRPSGNRVTWGKKLGHWTNLKEDLVDTGGHIFESVIMNLAQNVCIDDF